MLERVHARDLSVDTLRAADPAFSPCDLVTADLSFISLRAVVPSLCGPVSDAGADLVLLVKPQFEAGRAVVSRGRGVVRDPAAWLEALSGVTSSLRDARTGIMGAMASPLTRPAGNVEFLVHARKGVEGVDEAETAALLSAAVSEAAPGPSRPAEPPHAGEPSHAGVPPARARYPRLAKRADHRPDVATVTFLVHPKRADALALAGDTAAWLQGHGHKARILQFSGPDRVAEDDTETDLESVDLGGSTVAVSLGGDGTFLRVVRLAATADVPVIGVNFGRLGYLPDLGPDQLRQALTNVFEGKASIEERSRAGGVDHAGRSDDTGGYDDCRRCSRSTRW